MVFWLTDKYWGGVWRYAALDVFALIYFYRKWAAPLAQHRQFHFLLMCSYLISTAFYAFRMLAGTLPVQPFGMSTWTYELISNILFGVELALIIVYGLLYKAARIDRKQYYERIDRWFEKAGAFRRNAASFLRNLFLSKRKP